MADKDKDIKNVPMWKNAPIHLRTIQYHHDAGHGWIKVKRSDLRLLNVENKISSYSYQSGDIVYLEEDRDAMEFTNEYEEVFGVKPEYEEISHGDYSKIRSMESFCIKPVMCKLCKTYHSDGTYGNCGQ